MTHSIARAAVAAAILSLCALAPAMAAAPKYKLVLLDNADAVTDIANHGWTLVSSVLGDKRCQRQVCTTVPALPNDRGSNFTESNDVNGLGHVVGASAAGDGTVEHAFMFDGNTTIDLGVLEEGGSSYAAALNSAGQVVGAGYVGGGRTHRQAFLWQDGMMKNLGTLGGTDSFASDINRQGHVTGTADLANGQRRAFVYRNGRMKSIGTLPGDDYSDASAINDAGQIAGNSRLGNGDYKAFVYQDGAKTQLPLPSGAVWAVAVDINNPGWVVGVSQLPDFSLRGWVYDGTASYSLGSILTNFDPRYTVQGANAIADNGQIAVSVYDNWMHKYLGATLVPVK